MARRKQYHFIAVSFNGVKYIYTNYGHSLSQKYYHHFKTLVGQISVASVLLILVFLLERSHHNTKVDQKGARSRKLSGES